MKKHDEGYVLAYVTVVLLIFCLVATMILTGALRNLENQQNTITQMQDQYTAEGEIEKVIAALDAFKNGQEDQTFICGETVDAVLDETKTKLTLTAHSGSVLVTCELELTEANVTVSDDDNTVSFTGLTDYKIVSYQIGTYTPPENAEEAPE